MLHALLLVGVFATTAAGPPRAAAIPPDAAAWWMFDPAGFDLDGAKGRPAVVNAGLRSLLSSGVLGDEQSTRLVQGVLAASVVGSVPHTLCILDIGQAPEQTNGKPAVKLSAVLALRTAEDHRPYIKTIEAILLEAGGPLATPKADAAQHPIDLPGGRKGVAYTQAGWPVWREVSWCSTDGSFVVGIGKDSLAKWFRTQDKAAAGVGHEAPAEAPEWTAHERAVGDNRPAGEVFLEAFVSLNRIRQGFPDAFPAGRLDQLLRSSSLTNGRSFMLHARWIKPRDVLIGRTQGGYTGPPLIAIDATWSARSEPLSAVRRMALSESAWPADLVMPPPPGTYAVVVPMEAERWLARGLELFSATLATPASHRFALKRAAWQGKHSAVLGRVTGALGPWLVISNYPRPPILGAACIYAELTPRANAKGFAADLGSLLDPFADHVSFDPAAESWSLRADPKGWFQVVSWGLASVRGRSVLLGGVDLGVPGAVSWRVVEQNREWLAGK